MTFPKPTASTVFFTLIVLVLALAPLARAETPASDPPTASSEETIADPATGPVDDTTTTSCPRCGRQRGWRGGSAAGVDERPRRGRECGCGHGGCGRGGRGREARGANDFGRGPGAGRGRHGKQEEMAVYRELLDNHDAIERTFEEIPGGIRSTTTSSDPELVPVIQRHVRQMTDLVENGGWIRRWDPLFAEIFHHADAIDMSIDDIDNGVVVTETSTDEQVVSLIRAHARKVMDFAARGYEAYDEETPLPEGYECPAE